MIQRKILRMIDANLNRATEGLRVAEDVVRFVLDDSKLTARLKGARHELVGYVKRISVESGESLSVRDVGRDVGAKRSTKSEGRRSSILDVFMANIKRAEESVRVFEETSKLFDAKLGPKFKKIRFELYEIEQKAALALKKKIKLDSPLHIITDNSFGYSHLHIMKEAAKAGARVFQYREKCKVYSEQLKEAKQLSKYAKKHNLTFIVNDDLNLAKKVDADGVHLGVRDKVKGAWEWQKTGKIVGISASNMAEARRAQRLGADYIGFGPVFKTPIKPLAKPTGLKALRQLTGAGLPRRSRGGGGVTIPVVAIGGVCAKTIGQVMRSGAASGAVIRYVSGAEDIKHAVRVLLYLSGHGLRHISGGT
jgi:thiamine-phosphate pyrophosphorylase